MPATPIDPKDKKLSPKEKRLVECFEEKGMTLAEAGKEAGYKGKMITNNCWKVLNRPHVLAYRQTLAAKILKDNENRAARKIAELIGADSEKVALDASKLVLESTGALTDRTGGAGVRILITGADVS